MLTADQRSSCLSVPPFLSFLFSVCLPCSSLVCLLSVCRLLLLSLLRYRQWAMPIWLFTRRSAAPYATISGGVANHTVARTHVWSVPSWSRFVACLWLVAGSDEYEESYRALGYFCLCAAASRCLSVFVVCVFLLSVRLSRFAAASKTIISRVAITSKCVPDTMFLQTLNVNFNMDSALISDLRYIWS